MTDIAHFKTVLERRKKELTLRLEDVEDQLDETPDKDVEERAVEREGDEVLEGIGAAGQAELRQIEAALDRIEDGSFGICVNCGEDISPERLEAVPHAARCRNCA